MRQDSKNKEDSPEEGSGHQHFLSGWRFTALVTTIILSVIGYLLFTLWGGWHDVIAAVKKVGFTGIVMALCLSLVNYLLRFMRWERFLKVLGYQLPTWPSFRIYMSGFALTTTPGKAGEALRSVFLKDYGMAYRQSFGAFFAERLSDLIAVAILATAGLWIYPDARLVVVLVGLAIAFVLFAVQKDSWMKAIERVSKKILPSRFAHIVEFVIEIVIAFRSCFAPPVLLYGIFLGVIAWSAEGLAMYYLLRILGADVSLVATLFIYGFSLLIGAITLLPGGLGGVEFTMLQLLLWQGVNPSTAVTVTIVIRLATLWFSVILGLFALPKKQITLHP